MNKACLEPIFDARRRLLIFGFHWWNCNGMYVKDCFRTRVEKLAEILYSTRDIWSYKTSKEPKILQVVGVRFSKILWFFSTLLIKLLEKIKLAFRIVQKSIFFSFVRRYIVLFQMRFHSLLLKTIEEIQVKTYFQYDMFWIRLKRVVRKWSATDEASF